VSYSPTPLNCPGHREDSARAGEPIWCHHCVHHLRIELRDLRELVPLLQLEIENGTDAHAERVSGSKERPIHDREKPSFCIDEIDGILDSWATVVREDRHLVAFRPARIGARLDVNTDLLLLHFDWLIGDHPNPDASREFGLEIRGMFRRASVLTHTNEVKPERCDGVICPRCDAMALEREVDWRGCTSGYVLCRNCGTLYTGDEYDRWVRMVAVPFSHRRAS
jgi:hypothetical protein